MKKITNEIIDERIKDKNFIRVSNYINIDTKIKLKCLIDGYEWETRPDHIMQCTCLCCRNNNKRISSEKTNDEIMKNSKIIRIGKYVNSRCKTKWRCLVDGYEWEATPFHVKRMGGCPRCCGFEKLTNEIIDERINNRKIIRIGDYIGMNIKIKWKCLVDGYEWETTPNIITHCTGIGQGCPKCSKCAKLSNDIIDSRLSKVNTNIERTSDFKNTVSKMSWRCKKDGCEWLSLPLSILKGHGCPECSGNQKLTNEIIDTKLRKANRKIERISDFVHRTIKMKWKCKVDNHIWEAPPTHVMGRSSGCPICCASKGEQRIESFLINNSIEYIHNYKFDNCRFKNKLPFDFYIPTHNLCIEYDGEQHYKSVNHFGGQEKFQTRKKIDAIKTKFCQDNNIKLLRIPFWDANKLHQILQENIIDSSIIK